MTKTILIADDDFGLTEVLSLICEAMGFETIVVDNAQCAHLAIVCDQPDVAIFDVNMPQADEGNVFDLMEKISDMTNSPVIVLTGQTDATTLQRCESLKAHYVRKCGNVWNALKQRIQELATPGDSVARTFAAANA